VINQKGIDPMSLDILAKDGILGLRRAKKRNMERLILACGGNAVHSFDDVTEKDLGYADTVYEQTLGEEKYTFVEGVKNPFSCTILIKGPNEYSIAQVKDAIRDGLRAVKNTFDDKCVVAGAGAFEMNCHSYLMDYGRNEVSGKAVLGIEAFANALLSIPKAICDNAGLDSQEIIINCIKKSRDNKTLMGVDINAGEPLNPILHGIFVKKYLIFIFNF
jgi:T-complex protein 1 subunit zeta